MDKKTSLSTGYTSPSVIIYDVICEGVLCGSQLKPGEGEDMEEGDDL